MTASTATPMVAFKFHTLSNEGDSFSSTISQTAGYSPLPLPRKVHAARTNWCCSAARGTPPNSKEPRGCPGTPNRSSNVPLTVRNSTVSMSPASSP